MSERSPVSRRDRTSPPAAKPEAKRGAITILLVDDHPVVCEGLRAILSCEADMEVVAEAHDGPQAIELFRLHRPAVTLMDLRMPGMSGVEATVAICKEFPDSRIIVLTTYDGDENIYRALQGGARAYLLKDSYREELVEAIRAVHTGERRLSTTAARRLAERPAGGELTSREIEVLGLIVKGKTDKEIGSALRIAESTVKWHVNSIIGKLGVSNRTEATTTALRRGIARLE